MTELDPTTPEGAVARRAVRRRLAVVVTVALALGLVAAVLVVTRPGHEPSAGTTKAVPVDVSCPTATRCVAVDDLGNAITYDNGAWSAPEQIDANGMSTVSCPTPTDCLAADVSGAVVRTVGDGRWSAARVIDTSSVGKISLDGLTSITVVSCAGAAFCMAGDVLGRVAVLHGLRHGAFEPVAPLAVTQSALEKAVTDIDCPTTTFCAAVTDRGQALEWDGQRWQPGTALTSLDAAYAAQSRLRSTLSAVSCTSPVFCVAVDPTGVAYTYDGSGWSKGTTMDPGATTTGDEVGVNAVSCASPVFCVAVDDNGYAVVFSGTSWSTPERIDSTLGLTTVACPSPTFCIALDDIGKALVYDGSSWTAPRTIDR